MAEPFLCSVDVTLRRAAGQHWNGRSYQAAPFYTWAPLTVSTWTLGRGLPSGASPPPGSYTLLALGTA